MIYSFLVKNSRCDIPSLLKCWLYVPLGGFSVWTRLSLEIMNQLSELSSCCQTEKIFPRDGSLDNKVKYGQTWAPFIDKLHVL